MARWSEKDKIAIAKANNQIDMLGNYICNSCKRVFPLDVMEVDHKKPKSKGGKDNPANLQLLCPPCNKKKGARKSSRSKKQSDLGIDLGFNPDFDLSDFL